MTPEILRVFAERFVGLKESKEALQKKAQRHFKKALKWTDKLVAGERLTEDPYCLTEYELAAIKLGLAKERTWQTVGRRPLHDMASLMKALNTTFQEKYAILSQELLSHIPNNTFLAESLEAHLQYCQKLSLDVDWKNSNIFPIFTFSQNIKRHRPQKFARRPSIFDHLSSLDLVTARAS